MTKSHAMNTRDIQQSLITHEFMRQLVRRSTCLLPLAFLIAGCVEWDDSTYHASRRLEERWKVGPRPTVVVQFKLGSHIKVAKGQRGEVIASLSIRTVSEISQLVADQRVRNTHGATFEQEGDTIRVIESPSNLAAVDLDLVVPPDCELELRGPSAEMCVGCDPTGHPGAPIPVVRLTAATEAILIARVESSSSRPPILDLEASQINLTVDGSAVPVTERIQGGKLGVIYRYKRP